MQYLSPEIFGILLSIQLLLMIVVGGLGTVHGAFFGAFLVGLLESLISISKDYLPGAIGNQPVWSPDYSVSFWFYLSSLSRKACMAAG